MNKNFKNLMSMVTFIIFFIGDAITYKTLNELTKMSVINEQTAVEYLVNIIGLLTLSLFIQILIDILAFFIIVTVVILLALIEDRFDVDLIIPYWILG